MTSRDSVSKRKTDELLALDSQSETAFGDNKNGSNPEFDWIQTVFEIFHMIWNVSVVSMQFVGGVQVALVLQTATNYTLSF